MDKEERQYFVKQLLLIYDLSTPLMIFDCGVVHFLVLLFGPYISSFVTKERFSRKVVLLYNYCFHYWTFLLKACGTHIETGV